MIYAQVFFYYKSSNEDIIFPENNINIYYLRYEKYLDIHFEKFHFSVIKIFLGLILLLLENLTHTTMINYTVEYCTLGTVIGIHS